MFIKKKPQIPQTIKMPDLKATTDLLQSQIKDLENFTTTEIPQMKQTEQALKDSLEKLAQSAKMLLK